MGCHVGQFVRSKLRAHRGYCGLRPSQFVVAECHNILKSHLPYGRCSYNLIYYQGTSNDVVSFCCIGSVIPSCCCYNEQFKLPKLDWVYLDKINFYGLWSSQLVAPKATTFEMSQIGYSWLETITVCCG